MLTPFSLQTTKPFRLNTNVRSTHFSNAWAITYTSKLPTLPSKTPLWRALIRPSVVFAKHLSPKITNVLDWGFFFPQTNPFFRPNISVPYTFTPPSQHNEGYLTLSSLVQPAKSLITQLHPSRTFTNMPHFAKNNLDYLSPNAPITDESLGLHAFEKTKLNLTKLFNVKALKYSSYAGPTFDKNVKPVCYKSISSNNFNEDYNYFKIPTVRFRPGLRHQWRELRIEHARLVGIKRNSQARITKFVMLQKATYGFAFIKTLALSAAFLIKQSALFLNPTNLKGLAPLTLNNQHFLLNGTPLTNHLIQIYPGDVLQLTNTPSSFKLMSKRSPWSQIRLWRRWKLKQQNTNYFTTPSYLEVDELSGCIVLLYNPTKLSQFDPVLWAARPFLTHRLLNWKRIT